MKRLFKNEALREEMGMNGKEYVEREHDITQIVGDYIKLFYRIGELG